MPLAQFLQSMRGRCRYCEQQAGVLQRDHPECRDTYQAGIQEMVSLVTKAATDHSFNETALRQSLSAIANRSRATGEDIDRALEEGFRQGVAQAMADGIITRDEEQRLRAFRDRLALENSAADQGALARLDQAGADRVMIEARLAAISVQDGDQHLQDLSAAIRQAGLDPDEILIQAWEAAAESALEDGLVFLDEESALAKYSAHFELTQQDLDRNGVQTSLVQPAVIRDVTQGIIPQRQLANGNVPFNLMKSEQLVWVIQGVDYLETVIRRERQGTSHGLSIRVTKGLYYSLRQFRSRPIEWQEVFTGGGLGTPSDLIRMDAISILGDGITLASGVLLVVLIWPITNAVERKGFE